VSATVSFEPSVPVAVATSPRPAGMISKIATDAVKAIAASGSRTRRAIAAATNSAPRIATPRIAVGWIAIHGTIESGTHRIERPPRRQKRVASHTARHSSTAPSIIGRAIE
jgi:hypothetical protein